MSTTITGVVTNGVVVPDSALPEGARVEIRLVVDAIRTENPLLHFRGASRVRSRLNAGGSR